MIAAVYLISFVGGVFALFFLYFFRRVFYLCAESSFSLLNSILSKENDDKKIKELQKKTTSLLIRLLHVFLVAILIVLLYMCPYFFDEDMSSTTHLIAFSSGSLLGYFFLPKRKSSYSELAMLLHRLALNNYNIQKLLFKREKKKNKIAAREDFLIISGLARSGTTALTKQLSQIENFSSLTYANMPFLLSPNRWTKWYSPKNKQQKERAHQDNIKIGLDTVEAFDEYFFKAFFEDGYVKENHLKQHEIDDFIYQEYLKCQSTIRKDDQKIYLSKNNNFLLRYNSLRQKNKQFKMVVMFRDPLSHANSLLNQHKLFSSLQKEDPFVLEYMNWLGHHEFGLNQKPFEFGEEKQFIEDKFSLDFWLQTWINYYKYVLKIDKQGLFLIDYNDFCVQPTETISYILKEFNISFNKKIQPYKNEKEINESFSKEYLETANVIYKQLLEIKITIQP